MDLLTLDDPQSADLLRFGGKLARLARARQRGFPVFPGVVVPPEAGDAALDAAATAFEEHGRGGARSAVWRTGLPPAMVALLGEADLAPHSIVRASTSLDEEPGWAGAFSSVHDVPRGDMSTAVTACLASAFAPRTLDRFERSAISPRAIRFAVLIQPEHRNPACGGSARVIDTDVDIRAIAGSPSPLLAGAVRGAGVRVGAAGEIRGSLPGTGDSRAAGAIAALVRRSAAELGCATIEWLLYDDGPVLLQAAPGFEASPPPAALVPEDAMVGVAASPGLGHGPIRRLRGLGEVAGGRPGDILVVDWPEPSYAPFLWGAAGLVTRDGDPSAHLFEVARSLHVPAVAQVDVADTSDVLVIDGTSGWVRRVIST